MKRFAIAGIALLAGALGCGGSNAESPVQACNDSASGLCEKVYACFTAAEIAASGRPAQESACVTMTESSNGCAAKTEANACNGSANEVFNGNEIGPCLDQINNLSCATVRDVSFQLDVAAPECAKVCTIPGA